LSLNFLIPKVERFMFLLRAALVPVCIKVASFVFKISFTQFGNGQMNGQTDT